MTLPPWLEALRVRSPGETPGEHIVRVVRALDGVSLKNHPEKLAELFLVNEPDAATAQRVSTYATNCGTSMREILCLVGCDHPLITCRYKVEMAVNWVLTAAREKGALTAHPSMIPASQWKRIGPGWGLHYGTPGKSNDHLEWALETPDAKGVALHGGGGRPKNAITVAGRDSILWSSGRPLRGIIDPDLLLRPSPAWPLTTTRGVQMALEGLGYHPGPVDGVMGTKTRAAVVEFQRDHGLEPDGKVGPMTRAALATAIAAVS